MIGDPLGNTPEILYAIARVVIVGVERTRECPEFTNSIVRCGVPLVVLVTFPVSRSAWASPMLSRRSEPTVSRRQIFSFSFLPSFFAASVTLSPTAPGSRDGRTGPDGVDSSSHIRVLLMVIDQIHVAETHALEAEYDAPVVAPPSHREAGDPCDESGPSLM